MKYLAFILSIYILTLNLAPCADSVASSDAKTEFLQDISDNHLGLDACSPFCICQCCHISSTYLQFEDIKLDIPFISTKDFCYLIVSEKNFSTSISQPPRI
jgi:hypothetical protein